MSELPDLSAADLATAFAAGTLSPVEVTAAVLARIAACEPVLNAMYLVHADTALADAGASLARWRAGTPHSPLDGVPVTVKENIHTRGDPAPVGTAAADIVPMPRDAPPAARLREAGCVLVGKTTMPDFGMLSAGVSSLHGITRNPWNPACNTSGSSSGAGAAGAAGYGPLHVGTDIGGSVRLPAAHCGLFGLKPSLGRIPIDPPYLGRVAGPMTRTVRDAAMLLAVLARPDARDWMSLPARPCDYAGLLEDLPLAGLRVGWLADMGVGLALDPRVRRACADAAAALADAGAVVEPVAPWLDAGMLDGICAFFEARSHGDIVTMDPERRARVLPFVERWCTWRAGGFSGRDVMSAYGRIMAMREAAVRAVGAFDFVISPVSPVVDYPATQPSPGNDPTDALSHIAYTVAFNMSEQPAASVNWTHSAEGMPLGVQVIGQRFDDLGVLRLARALESLRPAQRPWPAPAGLSSGGAKT
jgi:Asp-tRNA(Asn)/Glu-tRNA(Gln) amidotransferase A subunit family amidase